MKRRIDDITKERRTEFLWYCVSACFITIIVAIVKSF